MAHFAPDDRQYQRMLRHLTLGTALSLIGRHSAALIINLLKACRKLAIIPSVRVSFGIRGIIHGLKARSEFVTGEVQMRDLKVEELSHVYGAGGSGGCGGKGGSKGKSRSHKSKSHKSKSHKSKSHKSKCHY
jgi:hypothetical protein